MQNGIRQPLVLLMLLLISVVLMLLQVIMKDYLNGGLLSLLLCLHDALGTPLTETAATAAVDKWDRLQGLLDEALGLLTAALQQKRQAKA